MVDGSLVPSRFLGISRSRVRAALLTLAAAFTIVSFGFAAIRLTTGHDTLHGLARLLDLNGEANIPAWYSSVLLLACSVAAGLVSAAHSNRGHHGRRGWLGIAFVLLAFSLDEVAAIHERFVVPPEYAGPFGPVRNITWVFTGIVVTGALVALFLRTVLASPPAVRRAVLVAGAIYAGGALGMEFFGGLWALGHGETNWVHAVFDALEEGGELVGASLFVDAALQYLEILGGISVRVG